MSRYLPPILEYRQEELDEGTAQWNVLDFAKSDDASVSFFSYSQPRHQRRATAVAWRPGASSNSRFVAVGLVSSSGGDGNGNGGGSVDNYSHFSPNKDSALVWDVEASSKGVKQCKNPTLTLTVSQRRIRSTFVT